MNQYAGKLCPFCKSAMQETEEIVVCSACEMPHHKECWIENQGCTTFGCLGTIQSPRQTAQPSYVQRSESGNFQAIRFDRLTLRLHHRRRSELFLRPILHRNNSLRKRQSIIFRFSKRCVQITLCSHGTGRHFFSRRFGSSTEKCTGSVW